MIRHGYMHNNWKICNCWPLALLKIYIHLRYKIFISINKIKCIAFMWKLCLFFAQYYVLSLKLSKHTWISFFFPERRVSVFIPDAWKRTLLRHGRNSHYSQGVPAFLNTGGYSSFSDPKNLDRGNVPDHSSQHCSSSLKVQLSSWTEDSKRGFLPQLPISVNRGIY